LAGVLATNVVGAQTLPPNLRVVLENTKPLECPRAGRLPLYVLPISGTLSGLGPDRSETLLRELDRRLYSFFDGSEATTRFSCGACQTNWRRKSGWFTRCMPRRLSTEGFSIAAHRSRQAGVDGVAGVFLAHRRR
jgi:hypothetical protein